MGLMELASGSCKNATDEMMQCCQEWDDFLQLFHKVVLRKNEEVIADELTTKDKSNLQRDKLEVARLREDRAKERVDKEEAYLQGIRKSHESTTRALDNAREQSTGLYAIGAAGISGIHYVYANLRTGAARERHEAMIRMRETAELERKALEADLVKLSDQNTSLDEVKVIVGRAIKELSRLQSHITRLLLLFKGVSEKVHQLQEYHNTVFFAHTEHYTSLNENSSGDIQNLYDTATEVRKEFANIHVIAAVYAEVSNVVIMPGFEKLNELLVSADKSDSAKQQTNYDMSAKAFVEIDEWRDKADRDINSMIKKTLKQKSNILELLEPRNAQSGRNEIQG